MELSVNPFVLKNPYQPMGDQPEAIRALVEGIRQQKTSQVLLGVTGSGKTFTMANVIAQVQKPTLILCHNKTLAAQLFAEFREFFPNNAVEYFVSYYDYYQPEAYIPSTDTYIEKDSQINEEIDKLRHSATRSLLERNDVIIVSSISCIYGLGSPEAYEGMMIYLEVGREINRQDFLRKLVEIQYTRNDVDFHRGTFRVRGDVVEVYPAYEEDRAIRIEFFGDEVEVISEVDPLRGIRLNRLPKMTIFPASHYVTSLDLRHGAMQTIRTELREHLMQLKEQNKLLEAQRLEQRTMYDLEMIEQIGFCQGIENYSRHLTGRPPGAAPPTLLEYFPKDWLLFVDESHVTVPQIGGMYRGDRARKMNLVEHGFRLPSALDNRPLNFEEWEKCLHQTIYVSATPGDYELKKSSGEIVEQVIRPTGLVDPLVEVRPAGTQVDNLLTEIRLVLKRGFRVLVTTLTKKLAEDLTDYYSKEGIRVKYLHSDIDTMERVEILRDLRLGTFDVLVGINLLREGLDLPEVALVAILDADKEGFLRSSRSLIQTIGRAARNSEGTVILYADKITDSMQIAMNETARRRSIQEAHNEEHHIAPRTIQKEIKAMLPESELELNEDGTSKKRSMKQILGLGSTRSQRTQLAQESTRGIDLTFLDGLDEISKQEKIKELAGEFYSQDVRKIVHQMEKAMRAHAQSMEFEKAAALRDRLKQLRLLSI